MKANLALSLGAFLALASLGAFYMSFQALSGALDASQRAEAIAERVSSGFNPIYQVTWIEHKCSGVMGRWIPGAIMPALCPPYIEVWRTGSREKAIGKVSDRRGSPGLRLIEERGPLEKDLRISWEPEIKKAKRGLWR